MLAGGENAPSWKLKGANPLYAIHASLMRVGPSVPEAAEFEQQPVVPVARNGAFNAETRAPEIEAVAEVARGTVLPVRVPAHRAAAKVLVERARGDSPYRAPSS